MGRSIEDKVLHSLRGKTVVQYSFEAFAKVSDIDQWVIVYRDENQRAQLDNILTRGNPAEAISRKWAQGGATRQDSVWSGLQEVAEESRLVFIHDAARPLIQTSILEELMVLAGADGNASLAHRVTDTIKETPESATSVRRQFLTTKDRTRLWAMETPQVCQRDILIEAYREVSASGTMITDDTAALELSGFPVTLLENPYPNPKVTYPSDLSWAEFLLDSGILDQALPLT